MSKARPAPSRAAAARRPALRSATIQRLVGLAHLWSAVSFFHPFLVDRVIDWDGAVVEAIPTILTARSKKSHAAAIERMIGHLDDPATRLLGASSERPPTTPPDKPRTPAVRWVDGTAIVVASDFNRVAAPEVTSELARVFSETGQAKRLVIDTRGATMFFDFLAPTHVRALLTHDVQLPSTTHRMHSGFRPDTGDTSGGYYSSVVTTESSLVAAERRGKRGLRMAFVVDSRPPTMLPLLTAMQSSGLATIVHVGTVEPVQPTEVVNVGDGVRVVMRTGDWINADGSTGYQPAVIVDDEPRASATADRYLASPAVRAALAAVAGRPHRPATARRTGRALPRQPRSASWSDTALPSLELRLLALFRFWAVIRNFFPYHHLSDRDWDDALPHFIPRIVDAATPLEYQVALSEMATWMDDTHAGVAGPALTVLIGEAQPAVRVGPIEGQTVVTATSLDVPSGAEGLEVGDVLVAVDGRSLEARRAELCRVVARSTPQSLDHRVHTFMLGGTAASMVELRVRKPSGRTASVSVRRTVPLFVPDDSSPVFRILPEGFGYMDLRRLLPDQVDEAFASLMDTPAMIFDMRGYPNGTAAPISAHLAPAPYVTSQFRRPELHGPNRQSRSELAFEQRIEPSGGPRYVAPLAVLINAAAISQSEHSCLCFEGAAEVTFVGSPTAGANGDVTTISLPGGLTARFSGHDVRHADGGQLQRVGIIPDVFVEPTIAGIRAGRDEVLEAAVEHMRSKLITPPEARAAARRGHSR